MTTLKDVAERSGITVTTVSRILNNRGYISEKTRKKVYEVMKELNYQPNELARSLSKKHTSIIGVIVPSIMHPFFSKVINYLEYFASEKGYKVMVCNSHRRKEKEIEYIDMLKSNKVAGIVVCSRTTDIDKQVDLPLPVVSIERPVSSTIPAVLCDNYQGGALATKRLIESGCKHIAVLGGNTDLHLPADNRTSAFLDVCKQENVEGLVFSTVEAQFQTRHYGDWIEKILKEHPDIDGIFATSDVIAAQVIQVCTRLNLKVPEDIGLIGFDDVELATLTQPALTTIHQPVNEMCNYAIDIIIRKLNGEMVPIQTVLPVTLIERDSVKCIEVPDK